MNAVTLRRASKAWADLGLRTAFPFIAHFSGEWEVAGGR